MHTFFCSRAAFLIAFVGVAGCATWVSPKQRESARISYDLGVESLNRQDLHTALRELMAAVQSDPLLPQAHQALGLVLHTLHHDADAEVHYRRALALKTDYSEATNNLGVLLLDTGRYAEAIDAFGVALGNVLYPTPYLAEGNMGWAYYHLGDMAQARQHVEAAVRLEPRFCRGYQWLARMAWEQGPGVGEVPPRDAEVAAQMVQHSRRFVRHCLEDGQVAKTVAPTYRQQMLYYLGMGLWGQNEPQRALEQFTQCTAGLDPVRLRAPTGEAAADLSYARRCQRSAAAVAAAAALSP